ncbi:E3 ubiquitin-protein ligase rnf152 isoform X1 [Centroberyx affinis]|uniref:E3 ubiquitin-protein ligase rnf152 isoform X1 n=1 Tax=Centroberyx affinis TaxID=166261 RepID=UPI003A5BE29B
METLSQDSILECQICFNYYSPRRRPKLLDCRHTCCSVCLTQMRSSQKEIRCPWCRGVTKLPAGLSVSQLPDDPDIITVIAIPHASEHTPVFIRLPSNGCYMLPLPVAKERALGLPGELGCRFLPGGGGGQQKGVAVVTVPEQQQQQHPLGLGLGLGVGLEGVGVGLDGGDGERRGGAGGGVVGGGGKGSTWSGVCTVILVACVLLFLLGIVLHNMSCISKRFTVISCG